MLLILFMAETFGLPVFKPCRQFFKMLVLFKTVLIFYFYSTHFLDVNNFRLPLAMSNNVWIVLFSVKFCVENSSVLLTALNVSLQVTELCFRRVMLTRIASCCSAVHRDMAMALWGHNMLCGVTKRLTRVVDEVPAWLKDEIKIAFRGDVLEKMRRIGQALPWELPSLGTWRHLV